LSPAYSGLAFDPTRILAMDKASLALWVQAASARVFGFRGLSLLLPQAIAGMLSVYVLYRLVGRAYGTPAGLLSALTLAVRPVSVVASHSNLPDTLLVLSLLLAAWAVTLAIEKGSLGWLPRERPWWVWRSISRCSRFCSSCRPWQRCTFLAPPCPGDAVSSSPGWPCWWRFQSRQSG
jgi:4-amino-4-deoxy-L-arabinose transferase-like glycosyltransferase